MTQSPLMVLLTCEHGGNQVPRAYRKLFKPHRELLQTHRGWDPGTKHLAEGWQKRLGCELHMATVTRLLVDLNRSPHHRQVFSEVTRDLAYDDKQSLLQDYHRPHRLRVEDAIKKAITAGYRVVHIGVHSFTPELHGKVRQADVGLLYDPARVWEAALCRRWRTSLRSLSLKPRVRLNYPYRGNTDGLTTTLRKFFPVDSYAGIEIELNQALPLAAGKAWRLYQAACMDSLQAALE